MRLGMEARVCRWKRGDERSAKKAYVGAREGYVRESEKVSR